MTCDSDGKIDHFIGERYPEKTLSLHPFTNQPYYLGIFFVGAYQEILCDLHNLFGDTNAVHVELNSEGEWLINQVVEGDTMEEVLSYAQYHPLQLTKNLQILLEKSLRNKSMTNEESALMLKKFKTALENYTYLTI